MTFRIHALPLASFRPLFDLDDDALEALGARSMIADTPHSAPCRVSLTDAEPGDRLILLNHRHLDAPASPYRSKGPIFVRETATEASPLTREVPVMLSQRLLSVRTYDAAWVMTDADVLEGTDLAARLDAWFTDPAIRTIHIHGARRGCFLAEARRA